MVNENDSLLKTPATLLRRLRETPDDRLAWSDFVIRYLELVEEASERVRQRVAPKTWEAFRHIAILNRPAREVAQDLDMPMANVFKAKSNVRKMIQQEIHQMEMGPPS